MSAHDTTRKREATTAAGDLHTFAPYSEKKARAALSTASTAARQPGSPTISDAAASAGFFTFSSAGQGQQQVQDASHLLHGRGDHFMDMESEFSGGVVAGDFGDFGAAIDSRSCGEITRPHAARVKWPGDSLQPEQQQHAAASAPAVVKTTRATAERLARVLLSLPAEAHQSVLSFAVHACGPDLLAALTEILPVSNAPSALASAVTAPPPPLPPPVRPILFFPPHAAPPIVPEVGNCDDIANSGESGGPGPRAGNGYNLAPMPAHGDAAQFTVPLRLLAPAALSPVAPVVITQEAPPAIASSLELMRDAAVSALAEATEAAAAGGATAAARLSAAAVVAEGALAAARVHRGGAKWAAWAPVRDAAEMALSAARDGLAALRA